MVNPAILQQASRHQNNFSSAQPFHHVVIDDFFEADKAEKLLEEFPPFDPANAKNEFGKAGLKATIADIQRISPFYAEVYAYIASANFRGLVSQVTGIPDLLHDELMFGGGTHENLEGQELDPHVDFNFIEDRELHRRLNLLLYLNKEWDENWGGCLELHSNPRHPKENRIEIIPPMFNRLVIFETSEHSWHGFRRIQLPEGKKHLSRKLLSIYLYTHKRPAEEVVPAHATFYVQRPLPGYFLPGHTLTEADVLAAEQLLDRRDGWIEQYQKKEIETSRKLQELRHQIESFENYLQLPLTGKAVQKGPPRGMWADGWIGTWFEATIQPQAHVDSVIVRGEPPELLAGELELCIEINGAPCGRHAVQSGEFSLEAHAGINAGDLMKIRITSDGFYNAVKAGTGTDKRDLVMLLREISVLQEIAEAGPPIQVPLQAPVRGSGRQEGSIQGMWADGWIGSPFDVKIRLEEDVDSLRIDGYLPDYVQDKIELAVSLNGVSALRYKPVPGTFSMEIRTQACAGELLRLRISAEGSYCASRAGNGADGRKLAMVLREIQVFQEKHVRHANGLRTAGLLGRLRRFVREC